MRHDYRAESDQIKPSCGLYALGGGQNGVKRRLIVIGTQLVAQIAIAQRSRHQGQCLEVIDTATGASVRGVVTDPGGSPVDVSVERLVVLETDDIALLVAADSSAVDAAGVMSVQSGTRLGFAGGGLASQEALQVYVMSTPTLVAETLTSSDGTFVLRLIAGRASSRRSHPGSGNR